MKKQWKSFLCGVFATLLLVGAVSPAVATVGNKTATLEYSNIKVTLDGTPVNLVDVNGNPVEPFIIGGTTYLPIRAIANAFGLDVDWDGATQTVILTHPTGTQPSQPQGSNSSNGNSSNGNGTGGNGNADNFNTWDNPEQQNTSARWVLNTSTLKIHYPSCSEVRRIAPQNYSTSNLSEVELLSQGYTTCGRCH